MLNRIHVLVSLLLSAVLMVSAVTGLMLSTNTLVDHLRAAPGSELPVGAVVDRIAGQIQGVERIERAPSGELRVAFSNDLSSDTVVVDPLTGATLAAYQSSPALSWIRSLHR